MKEMLSCVLKRQGREPWGFRIIGGTEQGLTFKIEKVLTGYPADYGGLKERDFLVSVQGQEVFDLTHAKVVQIIKNAGDTLRIDIERGDHIVPNFEEIWPSSKKRVVRDQRKPSRGMGYIENAMSEGIPGQRDNVFTTVGKPKVTTHQYDNPIQCYSDETLEEMTEHGTSWKKTDESVQGIQADTTKFNPKTSAVLAVMNMK